MTALDEPAAPPIARVERVADAASGWADELLALGGRDPLLNFRDLKIGTLDLAAAEPETRKRLLDGESVTVTRLFPHEPLRSSALKSVRAIRDKARELRDERGIASCFVAIGIATWADPFSAHRPTAPVLLRPTSVTARDPAETDFVIEMAGETEVNPVLLHALDSQLGLRFEPEDLRDPTGVLRYPYVVERMRSSLRHTSSTASRSRTGRSWAPSRWSRWRWRSTSPRSGRSSNETRSSPRSRVMPTLWYLPRHRRPRQRRTWFLTPTGTSTRLSLERPPGGTCASTHQPAPVERRPSPTWSPNSSGVARRPWSSARNERGCRTSSADWLEPGWPTWCSTCPTAACRNPALSVGSPGSPAE